MSAFSFVDKMSANEPPIRVRALLSFLSAEEGGRQTPAFSPRHFWPVLPKILIQPSKSGRGYQAVCVQTQTSRCD